MGWNNPRFNVWRMRLAQGFAAIIVIGNVSMPVAVMVGALDAEPEERVVVCEERAELETSEPCQEAAQ
jgi:hypothetical protein